MNKNLNKENLGILLQAKEVISKIDDTQFSFNDSPLFLSSAGMHFRHVLDFYTAFSEGYKNKEIDYDKRERNEEVAIKREVCSGEIVKIISFLNSIENIDMGSAVTIITIEGITGNSSRAESTIGRELQFLLSHTVHHYAIIAMILKIQGAQLPQYFGIAQSTIEFYNY